MTAITTRRMFMKRSRLLIMGIVLTAVLSFALVSFNPPATEAQGSPAGVVGAYAEQFESEQSTGTFTFFSLHADRTFTLVEVSGGQQKTFVGMWQPVDALTVEGRVIGAEIGVTTPGGMDPPPLDVDDRDYTIVFQNNTYEAATVTSMSGDTAPFTVQRISVLTPPVQPPPVQPPPAQPPPVQPPPPN
jgi:hypothetical protein